ncbi:hypothetical protein BN2537_1825 [Streptomyces venezuelae]|nr:hypothetical protein BN2537_1825 [Streptomyces venezuelae]
MSVVIVVLFLAGVLAAAAAHVYLAGLSLGAGAQALGEQSVEEWSQEEAEDGGGSLDQE